MKMLLNIWVLFCFTSLYAQSEALTAENDSIYNQTEVLPEYPGGEKAMLKYLGDVYFSWDIREAGIDRKAFVQFVIEKNGEVSNVEIFKGSGSDAFDKECIEHMRKMPRWQSPGLQSGVPVRTRFVVPFSISF